MMISIGSYVRRGQRLRGRWFSDSRLRTTAEGGGYLLCGLVLSAASLAGQPLPLPLAALCAGVEGWPSLLLALGSLLGYRLFWGAAGAQGLVWTGAGLVICLALAGRPLRRTMPWLMPMLAGLSVAITTLMFRFWQNAPAQPWVWLLWVGLAIGAARVAAVVTDRRDPVMDWLGCGLGVLALAQIAPGGISLGCVAAGILGATAPFPAAALSGLALDLSGVCPVPMTAVLSLTFLLRLLPGLPKWTIRTAPAVMYLVAAPLMGSLDWTPAIGLLIGGACSILLPPQTPISHRRGETGMAQVRLELTAGVLAETEQLLLEVRAFPIEEAALLSRAADRACGAGPARRGCRQLIDAQNMPVSVLHRPMIGVEDLPLSCRKPGRLLLEIRRTQDQYRAIRADRDRQKEYRSALIQQYRFLSEYLQELADSLPRRGEQYRARYDVLVAARSTGCSAQNGDRCLWFAGTAGRYYVLLCDGMGTGIGAAQEAKTAASLLRRLLTAGYPAEYALRSLNSLCVLRSRGGAVTVDLAEVSLESGKITLYKWGATPSWILSRSGAEKIGTACPPPGLSVTGVRETVDKLSLRRSEALVLLSDGVDGEAAMRRTWELADEEPGEVASKVLRFGMGPGSDDATAAVIRLVPVTM